MAINKLNLAFVDGSTVINASMLNAFQNKINELVDAANGSSSGGTQGGGGTGGSDTPSVSNLFVLLDSTFDVSINSANGVAANNPDCVLSGYIGVKGNTKYTFKGRYVVAWYDSSKNFISVSPSSEGTTLTLTSPSNAAYCRFSFNRNLFAPTKMIMNEGETLMQGAAEQTLPTYPNLVNASAISLSKGIQSSDGAAVTSSSYDCVEEYIAVKGNTKYSFRARHNVAWYDSSKNFISCSPGSTEATIKTLTSPSNAAYCRFSVLSGTAAKYIVMNEGSIACN